MIIGDTNYLLRVKGFRHGASGEPTDPAYSDTAHDGSTVYNIGYWDGVKARENYIKQLNDEILGDAALTGKKGL